MKKLFTFLFFMFYGLLLFAQHGNDSSLIFTEWRGDSWNMAYIELTNVGDTTLDLSKFTLFYQPGGRSVFPNIPTVTLSETGDKPRAFRRLEGTLDPGQILLVYPVLEELNDEGKHLYKSAMDTLASQNVKLLKLYKYEPKLGDADSVSPGDQILRQWGGYVNGLYYHRSDTDSVIVDVVNLVMQDDGKYGGPNSVAGITDATETHILVRKANIHHGNPDFESSRGIDLANSEWLPIPKEGNNLNSNPDGAIFTTVGTHGDFHINLSSKGNVDLNMTDTIITVPWGVERGDSLPLKELNFGPGMSWQYMQKPVVADSAYYVCQTGDILKVFAVGNQLEEMDFDIIVANPTDDKTDVYPIRKFIEPGSWTTPYYVTKGNPVIDTIGNVSFATRVDTLFKYLDKAENSSWEIVWVDGIERPDLKVGDILKVTGADGVSTKEYYIDVQDYMPNSNALLSAITWPDMPYQLDKWAGDTIPNFSPLAYSYKVMVPYGTTNVPALVAIAQNVNAKIKSHRAISLKGDLASRTTTFTVTAEDDTTVINYSITFEVEKDPSNLQVYAPDPFFGEFVVRQYAKNCFTEIVNSGNVDMDLSHYMFVQGPNIKNPAEALMHNLTVWNDRYLKYVPGYKFTADTAEWNANPGYLIPDPNIDPVVAPGDVFVYARLHSKLSRLSPQWQEADITFNPIEYNIWGEDISGQNYVGDVHYNDSYYIFKILNDSVQQGLKPVGDPNDYELIDVFGDPVNTGSWVVAGRTIADNGWNIRRKPEVFKGVTTIGEGLGTNADDSQWIVRYKTDEGGIEDLLAENIGHHEMNPVTAYISTISSLVYLVSDGYTDETIRGVTTGTTVEQFYANIIKADTGQKFILKNAADGTEKALADPMTKNDTLIVTSADSSNITRYVVDVTDIGLDNNAVLVANSGSGYTIDYIDTTGTITGITYGQTIKEVLANITVPDQATLNVIDKDGQLVPLTKLNSDTNYVDVLASDNILFEVIAEDGKTFIRYQLQPDVLSSDAFVISDVFDVDQTSLTISNIPQGLSVYSFISGVTPVTGATMMIKDKMGFERGTGLLATDDVLEVVSEDQSNTVTYQLNFFFENLAPVVTLEFSDSAVVTGSTIKLIAYATDAEPLTYLWEVISGDAGSVTLVTPDSLQTDATFAADGDYQVQISVSDGSLTTKSVVTISATTASGIGDLNHSSVRIYPNPASEILNIDLPNVIGQSAIIEILDVTGKVIQATKSTTNKTTFNISKLNAGLYIVAVHSGENVVIRKVQVVK